MGYHSSVSEVGVTQDSNFSGTIDIERLVHCACVLGKRCVCVWGVSFIMSALNVCSCVYVTKVYEHVHDKGCDGCG